MPSAGLMQTKPRNLDCSPSLQRRKCPPHCANGPATLTKPVAAWSVFRLSGSVLGRPEREAHASHLGTPSQCSGETCPSGNGTLPCNSPDTGHARKLSFTSF
ncbi:hypothetical protein AAFF_G00435080 [Aldrovandia affinis]|uniref:Uncharacterized protein n=1 Tax=Aldrovandia affinis TaxID=143900 RepID=A0AAD7S8E9_9TELE|nr:hypothetical protein AAFF_G00435080 [Aldrovandia affinis]